MSWWTLWEFLYIKDKRIFLFQFKKWYTNSCYVFRDVSTLLVDLSVVYSSLSAPPVLLLKFLRISSEGRLVSDLSVCHECDDRLNFSTHITHSNHSMTAFDHQHNPVTVRQSSAENECTCEIISNNLNRNVCSEEVNILSVLNILLPNTSAASNKRRESQPKCLISKNGGRFDWRNKISTHCVQGFVFCNKCRIIFVKHMEYVSMTKY